MGSSENSTRVIAATMVIVIHALLLLIFESSMRRRVRTVDAPITYMTLIPVASIQRRQSVVSTMPFRLHADAIAIPDISINVAVSSSVTSTPPANIDWEKEAGAAAKRVVKNQLEKEAIRSLDSKPKKPGNSADDEAPGIFARYPPRAPGAVVNLGGGVFQTWTSNSCYISSEVDVSTGKRFEYNKCLPPVANESNLFDHLEPAYLKKPVEEICSKTMANCNHGSSSSEH